MGRVTRCIVKMGVASPRTPNPALPPPRSGYTSGYDFTIPRPIKQHATGKKGLYRTLLIEGKPLQLKGGGGFEEQATAPDTQPPKADDASDLERKFWKNITMGAPLYGADVPGSLFDERLKVGLGGVRACAWGGLPPPASPRTARDLHGGLQPCMLRRFAASGWPAGQRLR